MLDEYLKARDDPRNKTGTEEKVKASIAVFDIMGKYLAQIKELSRPITWKPAEQEQTSTNFADLVFGECGSGKTTLLSEIVKLNDQNCTLAGDD